MWPVPTPPTLGNVPHQNLLAGAKPCGGGPSLLPKASKIMCATHREVKQTYPSLGQRKVDCWVESGEQSCGGGLIAKSCLTLATPWTIACQIPLSMGFSSKE